MLSVIIPTWNADRTLAAALSAHVPAAVDGVVREVIVVDCGSTDQTRAIADAAGAKLIEAPKGRGIQLAAGAEASRQDWMLFLHADTVLETDWYVEAAHLIDKVRSGGRSDTAAAFHFALDDAGFAPRLIEWGVAARCHALSLPFGDQGLLISRRMYDAVGGFQAMPLFEDVDIVRRLGRRRLVILRSKALTSPERYRRRGYVSRVWRNWRCIALYCCGASPKRLEKIYNA